MSRVLPILFNTDMVRAILNGRKTVTRRAVKKYIPNDAVFGYTAFTPKGYISCRGTWDDGYGEKFFKLPCQKEDILYVQETWKIHALNPGFCMMIKYKVDNFCNIQARFSPVRFDKFQKFDKKKGWQSPYFMPKEAARIWLKVTNVRVERLQEITDKGAEKEGAQPQNPFDYDVNEWANKENFKKIWNSTIKKSDLDRYGWDASPWVWVIEFERCEKPEEDTE